MSLSLFFSSVHWIHPDTHCRPFQTAGDFWQSGQGHSVASCIHWLPVNKPTWQLQGQRKRRRCWYVTVPIWKNTGETDGNKKTPLHFWSEVFEIINTIWQRPKNILRCHWQRVQFTKSMTKRPRLLTRRGLFATKNYLDSDSVVSSVSGAFSSSAAAVGWLSAFFVTRAIAFLEKSR